MRSSAGHVRAIAVGLVEHGLADHLLSQPQVRGVLAETPLA